MSGFIGGKGEGLPARLMAARLEEGSRFLVDEEAGIWVGSQTTCGAGSADGAAQGVENGFGFSGTRNDDNEVFC